jgi:hypothetical protein
MNPQQQQIVAQYDQRLQQGAAQLHALIQQSAQGAQQLIAQNPTDPTPLANALGAISQQANDVRYKASECLGEYYDRVCAAGSGEPSYSNMKRAQRAFGRWAEDAWHRFEIAMHVEAYRAMWPHVQQSMQKPVACTRCGAPMQKTTPHKSESITCSSCKAANQVTPETVVGYYYGGMPHYFAESAVIDKRLAIDKFKDEWENHRDAEHAAGRDRPDEPLDRLKQLETMEKDYWTTYAETRVKYEDGKPDDVKRLVDARMKQAFYDEMGRNDTWRKAHGQQSVQEQLTVPAHLKNVDEWGPLDPQRVQNALEENWVHEQLLSEAMRDPERFASMLKTLGYRDAQQRAMVHATFRRHYDAYMISAEGQAMITRAAMRAMNERMKYATAAAASGGILEPIEGVSLQLYAQISAKQAGGAQQAEIAGILAQNQMDQAKWERVSKAWIARMSTDTSGAIATEYSKAFMGGGQYGAAGQAAAQNMAQGQMGLAGPAAGGGDPMTFEKFCEVQGAMTAWSKQGKDVNAGLSKSFNMSAMDWSNVSMYWMQKLMTDIPKMQQMTDLSATYEKKYLSMP